MTTAEQIRAWRGPALLTFGFRPFFLGAGLWAMFAMALWIPMLSGWVTLPTAFDPASWHAHEFLFGYLGAVIAGFLLTAIPNWTGRLPIVGWPLAGLFVSWVVGRIAIGISAELPALLVAAGDLLFFVIFAAAIAREIISGRNWRNLIVLGILSVMLIANAIFHWEAANGFYAAQGVGLRLGLGAAIMLIALIGGRIVPSFTRNWLAKQRSASLPTPPMQSFDQVALVALGLALLLWVAMPAHWLTGGALLVASILHFYRLSRWMGHRTGAEPLLLVLHIGYLFLPLGALAMALEILFPGILGLAGAQHLWMAGGIGLMTLAVMTRATLGHTGNALTADRGTVAIYALVIVSVIARFLAGLMPGVTMALYAISGIAWIGAFGWFSLLYGSYLMTPRPAR